MVEKTFFPDCILRNGNIVCFEITITSKKINLTDRAIWQNTGVALSMKEDLMALGFVFQCQLKYVCLKKGKCSQKT